MGVNKVVFGAVSIMDISDSTVTPQTLGKGTTAYDKTGEKIVGTMEAATDPVLQAKTVTPKTSSQAVTPDSGYDGLSKVTVNAMPTATQATPSISVSSGGLITASATQSAGYVSAGTKSATKQLTVQAAQTITPGTSNKTIASGRYLTGTQTIKGDSNLTAANIAKGVSIFGVTGTHEGGEDISAETAEYTAQLDELESTIDSLPDAGSGGGSGSSETYNVTVTFGWYQLGTLPRYNPDVTQIFSVDMNGSVTTQNYVAKQSTTALPDTVYTFTVKNGDIFGIETTASYTANGEAVYLGTTENGFYGTNTLLFTANSDCTLNF